MTAEAVADTAKHIEVICINDNQEQDSKTQIVPHERQIIDEIISLWKEDPSTESLGVPKLHAIVKTRHPNWSLSEKRVKTLLKKFGLINNSGQQFCYANEITSQTDDNLELPPKVKSVMTTKRGKGLYAKLNIAKGELIWEEPPYFFIPPLANLTLMKHGKACSYCGKLLTLSTRASSGISTLRGLDCNVCTELWCSQTCKKNDTLHVTLKHLTGSKAKKQIINSEAFLELQDYCVAEQWNALYAIALIYAQILDDKTGEKGAFFRSMARVSQEIRYKALDSSAGSFDSLLGGALFVQEQQENLWREGYQKFSKVFPSAAKNEVDYKEFMQMLGCYNINNLDSCVFRIQSHLNHTCNPTASVETSATRTDGIEVYAARDIKAGEELTTTYVNPSHTVQQRQRELRCNWGFICSCQKCKDDLQLQHRRKSSTAGLPPLNKSDIKQMLDDAKGEIGDQVIELGVPVDYNGERRKSVRFDEKVIAVSD